MSQLISLNLVNDGGSVQLDELDIIMVTTDTLGARVYFEEDGVRKEFTVDRSPAKIFGAASLLIKVTDNDTAQDVYLNYERIQTMDEDGDGNTVVYFYNAGSDEEQIVSSDSVTTLNTRIATQKGATVYTIDEVDATNNYIYLVAGDGNVTSTFSATTNFNVIDNNFQNIYTVSASSFVSSRTRITTTEDIATGAEDSGIILL